MRLTLDAIEFGGLPGGGVPIPARRNAAAAASTQWLRGGRPNQLVYAIRPWLDATTQAMTVEVTITSESSQRRDVWISSSRAKSSGLLLGTAAATRVTIEVGTHQQSVRVPLEDVRLGTGGVGRHVVRWTWKWAAAPNAAPIPFASSEHEVFAILDSPASPWTVDPTGGDSLVWTDVLEWSCRWATGARSTSAAATSIARRLNGLGGLGFTTFGHAASFGFMGQSNYTGLSASLFECTDFLALLSGNTNLGLAGGNCLDFAAAVVTFANALGCALRLGQISDPGRELPLNEVRLVGLGRRESRTATAGRFPYHYLPAEISPTDEPTMAYDALLEVDFDTRPAAQPSQWGVAAGLRFSGDPDAYVERLVQQSRVAAVRWVTCENLPIDMTLKLTSVLAVHLARYEQYLRLLGGIADSAAIPPSPPGPLPALPVRVKVVTSRFVAGPLQQRLYVVHDGDRPEVPIWVSAIDCPGRDAARRVTAEVLAWTDFPLEVYGTGGPRHLADATGQIGGFAGGNQAVVIAVSPGGGVDIRPLVASLALALS